MHCSRMRTVRCSGRLVGADTHPRPRSRHHPPGPRGRHHPPGPRGRHPPTQRQTPPAPVDRILGTRLCKHYLSTTTVADGNNDVNTRTIEIPQHFALPFSWLIRSNFFLSFAMHTSCKFLDTINKFELVWGWITLGLYLQVFESTARKPKDLVQNLRFVYLSTS